MAAILGRVLRRMVRHINPPMWLFLKAARMQGVTPYELSGFRCYARDHDDGAFAFGAPTSDVLDVTGREPEDFETIAGRYASLPIAVRSLGNTLREAVTFMAIPFFPGFDLDRIALEQLHPAPPIPRFAMADERWRIGRTSSHATGQTPLFRSVPA